MSYCGHWKGFLNDKKENKKQENKKQENKKQENKKDVTYHRPTNVCHSDMFYLLCVATSRS